MFLLFDCCSHGYKIVSIIYIISLLTTIIGKEWYDMINFPLFFHIIHILFQWYPYSFSYYPHCPIHTFHIIGILHIIRLSSTSTEWAKRSFHRLCAASRGWTSVCRGRARTLCGHGGVAHTRQKDSGVLCWTREWISVVKYWEKMREDERMWSMGKTWVNMRENERI